MERGGGGPCGGREGHGTDLLKTGVKTKPKKNKKEKAKTQATNKK